MLKIVHMKVNGREVELAVDERESLLDTLRQRLGLTSVKKGCEVGECGACTVLVNGEAIDSCIYMTLWAEGKSIMTVEGLKGPNGELSPIQKAFIEEAAVQCGFCTPGLIMSAVEIVGTGKKYNREELKKLISGHLCRCTGYENILNAMERHNAVQVASQPQTYDGMAAAAVESVEQPGQGKGGKCHGTGPSRTALMKSGGIGPHGGCRNQGSLDQDIPYKGGREDTLLWISGRLL